ncbi:MAG: hypothetical protein ACRENI_09105 [Gemmatimonadaceae bacterium]
MAESKKDGAKVGAMIRNVARKQVSDATPPEAKRTYDRLRRLGYSDAEAIEFIASALATEMFEIMKYKREHDKERYEEALRALPSLPSE